MLIEIILISSMLIGIILIIVSLRMTAEKELKNTSNYLEIENTIRAIDTSIAEVDSATENLNKLSKSVFAEFEEKYQEILFIYSLIDEKKKEVAELYSQAPKQQAERSVESSTIPKEPKPRPIMAKKSPQLEQILKLDEEGYGVADIAKKLDMGKGEVKLILELGKER